MDRKYSRHSIRNIAEQARSVMVKKYGVKAGEHYEEMAAMIVDMLRSLDIHAQLVDGQYVKKGNAAVAHTWVEADGLYIDAAADRFDRRLSDDSAMRLNEMQDKRLAEQTADKIRAAVVISETRPDYLRPFPEPEPDREL